MKERYYVDLQSRAITQHVIDQEGALAIFADQTDLSHLRTKLDTMRTADNASFLRAHVPILRYSKDPENEAYDQTIKETYEMLYQLGTEDTRQHIKQLLPALYSDPKM